MGLGAGMVHTPIGPGRSPVHVAALISALRTGGSTTNSNAKTAWGVFPFAAGCAPAPISKRSGGAFAYLHPTSTRQFPAGFLFDLPWINTMSKHMRTEGFPQACQHLVGELAEAI